MKLDYSKISDIKLAGIDTKDYPDFTDAFIESASYEDRDMTDEELDRLNDDHGFVYEKVLEHIY